MGRRLLSTTVRVEDAPSTSTAQPNSPQSPVGSPGAARLSRARETLLNATRTLEDAYSDLQGVRESYRQNVESLSRDAFNPGHTAIVLPTSGAVSRTTERSVETSQHPQPSEERSGSALGQWQEALSQTSRITNGVTVPTIPAILGAPNADAISRMMLESQSHSSLLEEERRRRTSIHERLQRLQRLLSDLDHRHGGILDSGPSSSRPSTRTTETSVSNDDSTTSRLRSWSPNAPPSSTAEQVFNLWELRSRLDLARRNASSRQTQTEDDGWTSLGRSITQQIENPNQRRTSQAPSQPPASVPARSSASVRERVYHPNAPRSSRRIPLSYSNRDQHGNPRTGSGSARAHVSSFSSDEQDSGSDSTAARTVEVERLRASPAHRHRARRTGPESSAARLLPTTRAQGEGERRTYAQALGLQFDSRTTPRTTISENAPESTSSLEPLTQRALPLERNGDTPRVRVGRPNAVSPNSLTDLSRTHAADADSRASTPPPVRGPLVPAEWHRPFYPNPLPMAISDPNVDQDNA